MAMISRLRRNLLVPMILAAVVAATLASCGGDDEEQPGTAGGGQAGGTQADVQAYCQKSLEIETFPEPEIDFEALSPRQQRQEAKKFARRLLPLGEETVAAAPQEIKSDGNVLLGALREVVRTGNFGVFERPNVERAADRLHSYDLQNCGWERVDVTAVEYSFQGIPETLPAGPVSFELANEGKEPHELVVLSINEDVTQPFEQILRLPEKQARTMARPVGGTFAEPGGSEPLVAELEPGRYGVACFIPVGGKETGPPHATRGMFAEFTVR